MVLTDRQREDLHAGIHEYLLSQPGEKFELAAKAMYNADPRACERNLESKQANVEGSPSNGDKAITSGFSKAAPVLEKKWTAVPRLQRKVLELERALASTETNRRGEAVDLTSPAAMIRSKERRNIPRPPALLTLSGHTAVVTSVSLHPIYSLAASGSEDGTIKLWDIESGDLIKTLRGHTNSVTDVCFDDTTYAGEGGVICRLLASCSSDLSIKLWTWKEGSAISDWVCTKTLRGHDHTVSCVVFVPHDGSQVKGSSSDAEAIHSAMHLVSASRDATIRLWEVTTGFCVHTFSGHSDWVRCLALTRTSNPAILTAGNFTGSGIIMASGSSDTIIKLWTIHSDSVATTASPKPLFELKGHEHVVECVSFAVLSNDASTKKSIDAFSSAKNKAGFEISTLLASGSRDKTVRLWNISTQACLMVFNVHENWVQSVLLHPSGNYIMSGGDDRSLRVLEIKSQRCLRTITNAHDHFLSSISLHRSLPLLITGSVDQTIKCWALD